MVEIVGLSVAEKNIGKFGFLDVSYWRTGKGGKVVCFEPDGVGVAEGVFGVGEEGGDGGNAGGSNLGAVTEKKAASGMRLHDSKETGEEIWRGCCFSGKCNEICI